MPQTPVGTNLAQAGDAGLDHAPKVAFNALSPDQGPDPTQFGLGQVVDACLRIDVGLTHKLSAGGSPDSIDVGQRNYDRLVSRNVYAGDTCHEFPVLSLAAACVSGWSK